MTHPNDDDNAPRDKGPPVKAPPCVTQCSAYARGIVHTFERRDLASLAYNARDTISNMPIWCPQCKGTTPARAWYVQYMLGTPPRYQCMCVGCWDNVMLAYMTKRAALNSERGHEPMDVARDYLRRQRQMQSVAAENQAPDEDMNERSDSEQEHVQKRQKHTHAPPQGEVSRSSNE